MRRDRIVSGLLWVVAPAAVVVFAAAAQSAGCANTASDCAELGTCTGSGGKGTGGKGTGGKGTGGKGTGGSGGATTTTTTSTASTGTGGSATSGAVCEAKRAGDASDQTARGLDADAAGHLLAGGDFQGTLDFGVSALTAPAGSKWGFVALFDAGTLKPSWSQRMAATYVASALDGSGNVIIAGRYAGAATIDFGCGALDPTKTFFLAKIDPTKMLPAGACVFSKAFSAPMARATLAVAANGDIVLAGASQAPLNSLVELGSGPLPANGGQDVVIARFDATGATLWSHAFGSPGDEAAVGVALDPTTGDAFIAGDFDGQLDFATGGNVLDSGTGQRDIFFAGFDATGVPLWADHFKGPNDDRATGIAVVSDGVIVGGDYVGSIDLGTNHQTSAMSSAFVVGKLKLDGTPVWATTLDGKGNGTFAALAAGSDDGIVLTGSVTVDPVVAHLLLASLDKLGKPLYETTFPGAGLSRGLAVVTHAGAVDVAGGFDGTLELGNMNALQTSGGQDVFIARLCP